MTIKLLYLSKELIGGFFLNRPLSEQPPWEKLKIYKKVWMHSNRNMDSRIYHIGELLIVLLVFVALRPNMKFGFLSDSIIF